MRAERRTVECTTGGVRLLGGRRTDRGLVLVPQVRGWGSGWEVGVRRGVASTGLFPDGKEGAIVRPGSFLQICSIDAEQEERDL